MNKRLEQLAVKLYEGYNNRFRTIFIRVNTTNQKIFKLLYNLSFIFSYRIQGNFIHIYLKYYDNKAVLSRIQVISKVRCKIYRAIKNIPYFISGLGSYILSSHIGICTENTARKNKSGGEVLLRIN